MPEVILPCPACGSKKVYVRGRSNAQVTCRSCGMEGPEFCGPNQVIAAWNNLPRALTWTHEPPKVAGDYYYRSRLDAEDTWSIPRVIPLPEGYFEHIEYNENWQWAGPIAPPVEG